MDWLDRGIVLSARPHGEGSAVVHVLCEEQGRHAGLLRGASSSRSRGLAEPGTMVQAAWRARLSDHLGTWQLEPVRHYAADLLDDPLRLAGLQAACALADAALPERESHTALFSATEALLEAMAGPFWGAVMVKWETKLLESLGFGLDLSRCAATGEGAETANLCFVSPKTGRAVSLEGAGPYKEKLLALPGFLIGKGAAEPPDILCGLQLTGHFLARNVFDMANRPLPAARVRFVESLSRFATLSATVDDTGG